MGNNCFRILSPLVVIILDVSTYSFNMSLVSAHHILGIFLGVACIAMRRYMKSLYVFSPLGNRKSSLN